MNEDADMLSAFSLCFTAVERPEWEAVTGGTAWGDVLDSARRALQGGDLLGHSQVPAVRGRRKRPLQEYLSGVEVSALFAPPSFDEKQSFYAQHFVGGLPESVIPVESLYRPWSQLGLDAPFASSLGLYGGDSAQYMRDLIAGLGLELPARFSACPDHLSLELDMVAILLRSGLRQQAVTMLGERFAWLTDYRLKLLGLGDKAAFYLAILDVLMGIAAPYMPQDYAQEPCRGTQETASTNTERKQLCQKTL